MILSYNMTSFAGKNKMRKNEIGNVNDHTHWGGTLIRAIRGILIIMLHDDEGIFANFFLQKKLAKIS
jgi:hypothetical protein